MLLSRGTHSRRCRLLGAALLVTGMLPLAVDGGLGGTPASAELIQTFTPPVFTANAAGAIDIVGNTLFTCGTSANCVNTQNGTRNSGNGSFSMQRFDDDDGVLPASASGQTTSSSRAAFSPPAGSTVRYAGLYWSAQSNSASRNRLSFKLPNETTYRTITGAIANAGSLYQGSADVTALVQQGGVGEYWAGNIQANTGTNRYAAWSLVVVYENAALPVRNLSVYDGFGRVTSSFRTLDVPISGFLTPPFGSVNAEIGVVAYEGDRNIGGDQVRIDSNGGSVNNGLVNLSDASNPTTNFGNGSISDAGVGTGQFVNNLSVDIDEFATINVLSNSQTDTTVRFQTTGDWWYPGVLTTAIDLFVPEFPQIVKTVVDLNGGDALPGDQLEYSVSFDNTGNDGAQNSVVGDVIPADTTFVPGSIQVTNGVISNGSSNSRVEVNVGTGATAVQGGVLNPGDSTQVRFRVTIDPSAHGTNLENSATLDYRALTLQQDFTFTTNEVVTPVPPLARLRIEKTGSPDPVAPGNAVTWTINVFNEGPNDATGVTVSDSMANNTYASSSIACSGGVGATTVGCAVGDLAAGANASFTITANTDPRLTVGTQITNTAAVDANEDDDQPLNDSATARVTARPQSDLVTSKVDDTDPASPGDTIVFTISTTNNGPSDAHNVRISDQPDGAYTPTAISSPDTTDCTLGTRTCIVPVLAPGATATVQFTVLVNGAAQGTVRNEAQSVSDDPDPDPGNNGAFEDTTINAVANLNIDKTTVDAPLVAGETVQYRVRVGNSGPTAAQNVVVTDAIPSGLTLVSASPTQGSCSTTSPVTCNLNSIGNGGQVDVLITATVGADQSGAIVANTATVTSPTDPSAQVGSPKTDTETQTVQNSSDLRIVKDLEQANPVVAGTDFDFTIQIFNDGPSDSSAAYTVTDNVPTPLVVDEIIGAGCPAAPTNNVVCTSTDVIPAGGSVTIEINGTVPPGANADVDNVATVAYPNDPNGANNSSTAEVDLAAEADLVIDKEWVDASVVAGQQTTFTLSATNNGPSIATNASVSDVLPAGFSFVSATSSVPGLSCSGDGQSPETISCTPAPSAPAGASAVFTITVLADASRAAGPVNNTATITSATPDRNPDNNSDTDAISVTRLADLVVAKSSASPTPDGVDAGETITYTVLVGNAGPSTGQTTFLGDALPAGLTLVGTPSASRPTTPSPTTAPCSNNAGAISCELGELPVAADATDPGDPGVFTITYQAVVAADADPGAYTNTADASSPDDPDGGTDSETVAVEAEAELIVTKADSIDPATPGGPLTYTVTIENQGPSDARDVQIVDDLSGVDFTAAAANSSLGTCDLAVSCDIGTIAAGATVVITIDGTVDAGATGQLLNQTDVPTSSTDLIGNDVGEATTSLQASADLAISKSASPTTIDAGGGVVTYTIAVINGGPSDAQSVQVTDTLPGDFVVDSVTPSQGTCASATTFPCDLGVVTPSQSAATVTIIGNFPSGVIAGPQTNTAGITSPTDPGAQPGTPRSDSAVVDVTTSADVSVAKSGPIVVAAGNAAGYSIAVQNAGPSVATGVTLADTLDAAYVLPASAIIAVSPAAAGSCTRTGADIDCTFGDVAVGALITVSITVDVRPDAPVGNDVLDNTATLSATTDDPNPANDTSLVETDVTAAADLRIEKSAPATVIAGEAFDYTIIVTNDGPSDATGVEVADTAPAGVTFGAVTTSPPGLCSSLPCALGTVADGASVTVTVSATVAADADATDGTLGNADDVLNSASATATTADPNPGNDSNDASSDVGRSADLEVIAKTDAPDPVVAGQILGYTITARNNGPSTARNAVITDTVPANTTLVSSSLPTGCTSTGTSAGSLITCDLGLLTSGQIVSRAFSVTVGSDVAAGTTITNQAEASSGDPDPDSSNNDDTNPSGLAETTVGADADVSIVKTAAPSPVVPGETLTYTITVTNAGPSTARDVLAADDVTGIFDGPVTVTPPAAPAGITCDQNVDCSLFDLPASTAATFTISGTAAAATTAAIPNTATVSSPTDSTPGNNSSDITTPVSPSADVGIAKVGTPTTFVPGEAATYTITVTNNGPSESQNVVVSDTIPTEFTAPTTSTPGCSIIGQDLSCTFATIPAAAPGNTIDVVVTGLISDRAVGTVENTASIESTGTPDPVGANDSDASSNDVAPEADVQLTKTTVTSPVVAGQTVRYQITVFNNGPASAGTVEILDTLPGTVAYVNASTPVGSCAHDGSPSGGEIDCDLGTLGDQASITIDVDVLLDPDATGTLVNTATATSTTDDPDASNNNGANPNGSTNDLIVTAPDLRIDKQLIPGDPGNPDLTAGEPYEYQIIITNDGPSDALSDIRLVDQLPSQIDPAAADVTLSNTTDCAYTEIAPDRTIGCTFSDDLAVGDSITLTVSGTIQTGATTVDDNTAIVDTDDDDPNLGNNSSTATATLVTNADLDLSKTIDAPTTLVAGNTIGFTLSAVNNGPSDALVVVLSDTVPAGFAVESFTNAVGVTCTTTLTAIECTSPSVADGETVSVDVVMRAGPRVAAGPVNNTATIGADTPDRNPDNNTDVDTVQVTRLGDLDLTKTASPTLVVAGGQVDYTVTVTSNGPSSAEATVVGDPLPAGLTIIPTSVQIDGAAPVAPQSCSVAGGILDCELGELDPGTDAVVTYSVTVGSDVDAGSTLQNEASADSVTPLVDPPSDTSDVDINTSADLEFLSKTVSPDPVVAGTDVTYTLTVRNNGPSDARNVTFDDDLPTFVTAVTPLPAGCSLVGTVVRCDVGTVASGATASVTFTATVDTAAPTVAPANALTNNATVSSDEPDPDGSNNGASATTNAVAQADISIVKTAVPTPAVPGNAVTYTIVVTNDGPSDAQQVVVADPLPASILSPTATADDGSTCTVSPADEVSCDLGVLADGETVVITVDGTVAAATTVAIENTATVTSPTPPGPTNPPRTSTITTPIAPTTDLGISKVLDTNPPVPGQPVQYTITVTNPGPSDAQTVSITDSIDPAVTNLVVDQGVCGVTGQDVSCAVGTLAPGSFTAVVTGDLAEDFSGLLSNSATVTTSTDQGANTSPDTASVNESAAPDADLALTKTATPDPVVAGDIITYTIIVENNGPSTAVAVQVDDVLPSGLDLIDVTSSQGGCAAVPCDLGDLADGATATVTINAQVQSDVTDLQPNSASTTSTTPDSVPANNNDTADPVVNTSADLVTTKELSTPTAVPGTRVGWTISVGNSGPSDATDVVVADSVPAVLAGVTITSSQGGCTAFPCDLGTVEPGGSATITIEGDLPADTPAGTLENTAVTTTPTPDPVPGDNNPTASNPIAPSADVSILKVGPTTDLIPGQPTTFTITVTNDGPSDAQAVEFTDTLPAAIDPATIATTVTIGTAVCDPVVGSDVTCEQATLAPGGTYVVEITGTVLASVTDPQVDNTAIVTTTTPDPDPLNNSSTSTNDVAAAADLTITKALSPGFTAPIDPGGPVSYTITVANGGPSDAQNVVASDTLPTEITFGAIATPAPGATCDQGSVSCTFPTIAAGASVDVIVTGVMSDRAVGSVDNSADVTSDTADPVPGDNDVTITTAVTPFADVTVAKSLLTGPLTAGTNDRYEIVVTNDGPATAVATVVTDELPDGVVFVSVSAPVGTCVHDGATTGGDVTCDLGDLGDQASVTITIDVQVEADANGTLTNLATATTTTEDPDPSNNDPSNPAGSTANPVASTPNLQVTKSLVDDQLTAGGPFIYTIVVKNNGPSDALQPISLVDTLPSQVDQALAITVTPGAPACTVATGGANASVNCSLAGPLAVGDDTTVTISGTIQSGVTTFDDNVAVASTTGGEVDPDTSDNTGAASGDLATNADLVLTKSFTDPATVRAGETITFDLVVRNDGPSDAAIVQLDDVLPAGFSIAAAGDITAPGTASCSITTTNTADDTLGCTLGTVAASTSQTVTVTATVDPTLAAGPVTNTASVSSPTPDRNPGSNVASDQVAVTRFADLDLDKSVTSPTPPATVLAGETISYEIIFTNNGPSSAEGSVVGDPLSPDVTIDASSVQIDGNPPVVPQSCETTGNLLTCEFGDIAPGGTVIVTYDVTVDADYTGAPIENTATANSPTPNTNPSASTSTGVDTEADLELVSKTSNPTSVNAGEDIEYTITIRNNGPSVARNVILDDDIPAGVTVQAATLPAGCSIVTGGDVQCNLGDVPAAPAPGSVVARTFSVTVSPDQLTDINNQATVGSDTDEPGVGGAPNTADVDTTITTEADLVTTKVASPNPAVPGEEISYTITVTNNGPSVSRLVEVVDNDAPSILTGTIIGNWLNGANTGTCDATISCEIGDLDADASATVTITGTVPTDQLTNLINVADATSTGPDATPDTTPGDSEATANTPVSAIADIGVAKTIDTDPLVPGEPVQFTITVTNNGPSDALAVRASDNVDPAVTNLATTNGDCGFNGQLLECTIDRIEPGSFNAVDIVVTGDLDPSYTGDLANTVTVATDTPQGDDATPNTVTATGPAEPSADLALSKSASPDPVVAGENVTYEITVTNNGPSDALGVTVADVLPSGLTLVNVFSSQGACSALPCALNSIPDQGSATVTVVATVDSDRLDIDPNNASVTAITPDPTPGNNAAGAAPAVISSADVRVDKVLSTPTAVPGSPVRWTITVTNDGPSDALGIEVVDSVPAEVTGVVVSSSQGGCAAFPCQLGTIAADTSATITVDAQLPTDTAPGDLVNSATATSVGVGGAAPTPDPDPTNNTGEASNPIAPAADLRIEKIGPADDVVAGTDVSWTIRVTNDGPSDAQTVQVTDDLPAALDPATIVIDAGTSTCTLTGLTLTCDLATLIDGAVLTITIDGTLLSDFTDPELSNVATVTSTTTDPDPSDNSDSSTNDNSPLSDIVVTGTAVPSSVPAGTGTTFEFNVVNQGPSDAADTVITIPVPASVSIVGTPTVVGFPGATVTVVNGVITVDIGDLAPNVPIIITFDVDVVAGTPGGPLPVTATGTTATNQDNTANDAATVTLDVINDVDLSITKTASTGTVRFGDAVTFTITVTNDGESPAVGATINDDLPDGLVATSASTTSGSCTVATGGGSVSCGPLGVPANGQVVVTIVADAVGDGVVTNTATIDCDCITSPIASAPAPVDIDRRADLSVEKSVFRSQTKPGLAVTFTITVTNNGPDAAINTSVQESLPSAVNFVRAETSVGTYDEATEVWTIGDLASGATATLSIRVVALAVGNFTNTVTVRSDIEDPNTADNSASVILQVISVNLPLTGSSSSPRIIPISLSLLLAGVALFLVSRRRRRRGDTLHTT